MKNNLLRMNLAVCLAWLASCENEKVTPKIECEPIIVSETSITDASCGSADGTASFTVSGGVAPITFSVGSKTNSTGNFTSLSAGSFTVIATDVNGCESNELAFTINNIDGVSIASLDISDSDCEDSNGSLEVTVEGETGTVTYNLDGLENTNGIFSNLATGTYDLSVSDDNCTITQEVTIGSTISYSTQVANIINQNCAISACHGGSQSPNFTTFETRKNNADRIKTRTSARTMPPSSRPALTDEQIELLACWADAGAPNN